MIILEETAVNFSWFFNTHFTFFILGVIWVLGLAMIFQFRRNLIFLPGKWILGIGLLMVFGHNLLDNVHFNENNLGGFLWGAIHERKVFAIGETHIMEGYHIIPWVGVMAIGYCLDPIFANGFDVVQCRKDPAATGHWLLGTFYHLT